GSPGERHGDGQRKGRPALLPPRAHSLVRGVEAELPGAVTVHPCEALEVRARVLRQRDVLLRADWTGQKEGGRECRRCGEEALHVLVSFMDRHRTPTPGQACFTRQ